MKDEQKSTIGSAAESKTVYEATRQYADLGFSVIPLKGKRPALKSWKGYQQQRATDDDIETWQGQGLLENVGIVCGAVSGNLIVLDLDGAAGYPAFAATFPQLARTFTVATGGGVGRHVYFRVKHLPPSVKAMDTPIGNLELCGEGRQVVAAPGIHPVTGNPYQIAIAADILQINDLDDLADWIQSFRPQKQNKRLADTTYYLAIGGCNHQSKGDCRNCGYT